MSARQKIVEGNRKLTKLLFADPCFYNGSCSNTDGSYKCNCISAKTGKNCELEKAACDNNPCNNSDICTLSERSPSGFQCVDKQLEMAMVLTGDQSVSKFDLEKEIENLIKSAPNNANSVSTRLSLDYIERMQNITSLFTAFKSVNQVRMEKHRI